MAFGNVARLGETDCMDCVRILKSLDETVL